MLDVTTIIAIIANMIPFISSNPPPTTLHPLFDLSNTTLLTLFPSVPFLVVPLRETREDISIMFYKCEPRPDPTMGPGFLLLLDIFSSEIFLNDEAPIY